MRLLPALTALLLAACAASPQAAAPRPENTAMPTPTAPGETPSAPLILVLSLGEQARLPDDSQLGYLALINDSRCPPGVQCVWEGNAEIRLRWTPTHGPGKEFSLNTSPMGGKPTTARMGQYEIELQSLDRGIAPQATLRITKTGQ